MEPREQFAANLKRLRKRAGLTQDDVADAADLHRTEISLLERAGREPRLTTIVVLSRALGVRPSELLRGIR